MTLQSKRKTIGLTRFILTPMLLILASVSAAAQTNTFPTTGNAGAGTTSPDRKLEVLDSGSPQMRLTHTDGSVYTDFQTLSSGNLLISPTGPDVTSVKPISIAADSDAFRFYPNADTNLRWSLSTDASGLFHIVQKGDSWASQGARFSINRSGNVGIGTMNPATTLDIVTGTGTNSSIHQVRLKTANPNYTTSGRLGVNYDTLYITQNAFYNGASWVADDTTKRSAQIRLGQYANSIDFHTSSTVNTPDPPLRLRIDQNGNIGIGTTSPIYSLDVNGGVNGFRAKATTTSSNDAIATFENSSGIQAIIRGNGNVGIGTTTPAYKLDVAGEIRSSTGGFRFPDGSLQTTAASGGGGGITSVFGRTGAVVAAANDYTWAQINKTTSSLADLNTRSASDLSSGTLPDARFPATLPAASGANLTSLNASNLTSGTVGATRLGSGTPNSTTFLRGDSTWAAITSSQWANGSGNINYTTGNVGIGTTSPTAKLHVSGSGNTQAIVESTTAASELDLVSNAAGSGKWALGTGWSSAGSIRNLWFYDNVAGATRLAIDSSGNVGIGTTSPQEKLHVAGSIKVDGNINAKYQDLAEWVSSSEQLSAGTVVVLDTTKSNQVVSSTVSYDTRVAGVISAQPGITLGESGEGKVLVATTGRVRVKVDASRGAIQIGDLLVTSDVSGVAMKSEAVKFAGRKMHMPGTIIGKALEPLVKGSGEILVLLSLQ